MEIIDKIQDLVNNPPENFKWLEIVSDVIPAKKGTGRSTIKLKCSCGVIKEVTTNKVLTLNTKSCGCLPAKMALGRSHSGKGAARNDRLYRIWSAMRERCRRPGNVSYHNYGGRGIDVCKEWKESYVPFRDWSLANGYADDLSIDRINNDLDYSPNNCRWATRLEQANNTRRNVFVTIGNETYSIKEWCRIKNIHYTSVWERVKKGMSLVDAIQIPPKKMTNNNLVFITIGMVTLSVSDWCKELSILPKTVQNRVDRGWSWETAILTPTHKKSK